MIWLRCWMNSPSVKGIFRLSGGLRPGPKFKGQFALTRSGFMWALMPGIGFDSGARFSLGFVKWHREEVREGVKSTSWVPNPPAPCCGSLRRIECVAQSGRESRLCEQQGYQEFSIFSGMFCRTCLGLTHHPRLLLIWYLFFRCFPIG